MKRKKEIATEYESVKIKKSIVDKVRGNKVSTGVPVSVFFEKAAEEKLISETDYPSVMANYLMKESNKKKK